MPLTLNIDAKRAEAIKRHARDGRTSASRLVSGFIDGLSSERCPPSLGAVIRKLRDMQAELTAAGLLNVAVFGSVARGEERPGSDVDLLVKVRDDMDAFTLARIQTELSETLGAPVELVTLAEFNQAVDRRAQKDVVVAF